MPQTAFMQRSVVVWSVSKTIMMLYAVWVSTWDTYLTYVKWGQGWKIRIVKWVTCSIRNEPTTSNRARVIRISKNYVNSPFIARLPIPRNYMKRVTFLLLLHQCRHAVALSFDASISLLLMKLKYLRLPFVYRFWTSQINITLLLCRSMVLLSAGTRQVSLNKQEEQTALLKLERSEVKDIWTSSASIETLHVTRFCLKMQSNNEFSTKGKTYYTKLYSQNRLCFIARAFTCTPPSDMPLSPATVSFWPLPSLPAGLFFDSD